MIFDIKWWLKINKKNLQWKWKIILKKKNFKNILLTNMYFNKKYSPKG